MKYKEFDINFAAGVRIAEEIRMKGRSLSKGHELTSDDIDDLKFMGFKKIYGVIMEPKDVHFSNALGMIAAKLCGENTEYVVNQDASVSIISAIDGVFKCSPDRVNKFNRTTKDFILNISPSYRPVQKGEVIAVVSTPYPVLEPNQIDDVLYRLSGNTPMLEVVDFKGVKIALVYTQIYKDKTEERHFTKVVKRLLKEYDNSGFAYTNEYTCAHEEEEICNTLEKAFLDDNDVIFILPAQKYISTDDVVPHAVKSLADEVLCEQIPSVLTPDLLIATKKKRKIISLPYRYDEATSDTLHMFVLQAVVGDKLLSSDFNHAENVYLEKSKILDEKEQKNLLKIKAPEEKDKKRVAAVVLAAGMSKRAGRNKLLAEVGGEPLFMKAVHAAVRSKASPVFVVTGYQHEILEEALDDVDVNVIYNPDFRAGVKTSIRLGIKSVPSFCRGAIILPADMPNISENHLNKMIKSFADDKTKQVLFTSYKKVKNNPILWSSELYDKADIVPENVQYRTVFMDVADYGKNVEVKSPDDVLDITFPNDVESIEDKK